MLFHDDCLWSMSTPILMMSFYNRLSGPQPDVMRDAQQCSHNTVDVA